MDIDTASLRAVIGTTGGLLAWIALRMESFGQRLVRVETKMDNGISDNMKQVRADLSDVKRTIQAHIEGEEERIARTVSRLEVGQARLAARLVKKRG